MVARVVHIWLVRASPLKTAASCFCSDKTSESNSVLDGGRQVQVLKRAIEAADGSDKALVIVLIVQKVFDSLLRLHWDALHFHFLSLIW